MLSLQILKLVHLIETISISLPLLGDITLILLLWNQRVNVLVLPVMEHLLKMIVTMKSCRVFSFAYSGWVGSSHWKKVCSWIFYV